MTALNLVLAAFRDAGWIVAARESIFGGRSVNPSRIDLVRDQDHHSFLAYAWKITGEGLGRTGTNYRIQTTRSHEGDLLVELGRQTICFGVDESRNVIAVFDGWTKRATGSSSSVHIERATLDTAASNGYSEQQPEWDGRAAACYGDVDLLLHWVTRHRGVRKAAVHPISYSRSAARAVVVADLWNSAPAAWLRLGDQLVIVNRDGSELQDSGIWQIANMVIETTTGQSRYPRRSVTFECVEVGRSKADAGPVRLWPMSSIRAS